MRIKAAVLALLLLTSTIVLSPAHGSHDTSRENVLWSFGVPRVLDWSEYGLAVGTSSGYVLVYDDVGNLKWSRKVNYTAIWSISWSESGDLAVASLGPPGTVYVFDYKGDLLWSREFRLAQAYVVTWSGGLLAVGGGDLLVFDRNGKLIWSKNGSTLAASWNNDLIAAIMCLGGAQCAWGLYVFNKRGDLLWSLQGTFDHISWSNIGDLAVTGVQEGAIKVFDRSGRLKWERYLEEKEPIGALTWFGSFLAVGIKDNLMVLDEGGNIVWRYGTGGYFIEALFSYNEFLAVGSQNGNLTLFDPHGKPLWSYWTCGYIWAIDGHGDLIAAASSDGLVHVVDKFGNLLWRSKIGFHIEAVSLHDDLVAIGGWDLNMVVLDLYGNIKWSSNTGWVSHLAWYEDLLAVGSYERLLIFDKEGNLKWNFESGKVRSLSWSDDGLLAVGVSDRFGVFTKDGTLLWSYTTPDWVLSLSWSDGLLAVGIAGNGIFVFDKDGNLKWFFKSIRKNTTIPWRVSASWWNDILIVVTDATYALDRSGNLVWVRDEIYGTVISPGRDFVAFGGGRGVYVVDEDGEIEWNYTSPEVVEPVNYFTKLYPNNVFSLSWVNGYLVSGDWLGRVFLFNETGDLVWVYNMGAGVQSISGDHNIIVAGGDGGLLIKEVPITAKLPEKVLPELPKPYDRFVPVYEDALPSFEERRVYLPVGIVDYGVAVLPEGRIGYKYEYMEAWGLAEIRDLYATRDLEEETRHWVTLQLNAFLHLETEDGRQVYWVQNIINMDTGERRVRNVNNIWNITSYPISTLKDWLLHGNGTIGRERRLGDYYFYIADGWINYSLPVEVILYLLTRIEDDGVKIGFGRSIAGEPIEIYDIVTLNVHAKSAYFKVDPTGSPIPSNIELVLTGPTGSRPKTVVERVNVRLRLFVNVNGEIIPVPTAYSHGYYTHERLRGIATKYGGNYDVILTTGKTAPTQIYYSTNVLPSMLLLRINDPLGIFSALKFVQRDEALTIPIGHLVDLGNMTRLMLKGYVYTGKNEVTLNWSKQYYVAVYSEYGQAKGEGWYDEGGEAEIVVSPIKIEEASKIYIFQGWEEDGVLVSTSPFYEFKVSAPKTIKAKWIIEEKLTTTTFTTTAESALTKVTETTPTTEIEKISITTSLAGSIMAVLIIAVASIIFIVILLNLTLRRRAVKVSIKNNIMEIIRDVIYSYRPE